MTFEIPEGATVQIFIGSPQAAPLLSPPVPLPLDASRAPSRRRRPVLTGFGLAALAIVAFLAGQGTAQNTGLRMASNASALPTAPNVPRSQEGQPEMMSPPSPVSAPQLPPPPTPPAATQPPDAPSSQAQAFARQLQQPPAITPPPGSPAAGAAPAANPFGLEN